jgi:beta-lactamase superfamily II metal-dependent hydrolase
VLLHRIRSTLHGRLAAQYHDWASLVVYEALPDDLDQQLEEVRYQQAKAAVDAVFAAYDAQAADAGAYRQLKKRLDGHLARLPTDGRFALECQGLRASARKRQAELEFRLAQPMPAAAPERMQRLEHSCFFLDEALHEYEQAARGFLVNDRRHAQRVASMHWVMVQQLSLAAVLCQPQHDGTREAAYLSAYAYLEHADGLKQCWANASLAELNLLELNDPSGLTDAGRRKAEENALDHAREVVRLARRANHPDAIDSTRRQFERYASWWGDPAFEAVAMDLQLGRSGGKVGSDGVRRGQRPAARSIWEDNGVVALARQLVAILQDRGAPTRAGSDERPAEPPAEPPPPQPPAATDDVEAAPPDEPADDALLGLAAARPARKAAAAKAAPAAAAPAPATSRRKTAAAPRKTAGSTLRVEMLPAEHGDCLLIEYGNRARRSRVLIDCGTARTYKTELKPRLEQLAPDQRHFDLFILSHIDDDHIGGAIRLMRDMPTLGLSFDDIWFNGWTHIEPFQSLMGARQGEVFSQHLRQQGLPWNVWQGGGPIVVPDTGALPSVTLAGGMTLTLLSPTPRKLGALANSWEKVIVKSGKVPGSDSFLGGARTMLTGLPDVPALADASFSSDGAEANGSSIAVLAEFAGRRILLGADAHAPVLLESLQRLTGGAPLELDAFKLPHHGSRNNLSRELVQQVRCRDWLVSTSGRSFYHPDPEAIARVVKYGGQGVRLHFNYLSTYNQVWQTPELKQRFGYEAFYPEDPDQPGLVVTL